MAGKYDTPPPLPHEILNRVLRTASIDGQLLLFVPGLLAIVSAYVGDVVGAIASCCAAGAGVIELHGARRLRNFDLLGVDHLVRSQMLVLAVVLIYAGYHLSHFNPEIILAVPAVRKRLDEMGVASDQYLPLLRQSYYTMYVTMGIVSILYQGGLALYFRRSRRAIAQVLVDES